MTGWEQAQRTVEEAPTTSMTTTPTAIASTNTAETGQPRLDLMTMEEQDIQKVIIPTLGRGCVRVLNLE